MIVKRELKDTSDTMANRLAKVLFFYKITPQSTTGSSPSELLLRRRPQAQLDFLKPNMAERAA